MAFGGKKAVGKFIKLKESESRFYGEFWKVDTFKIVSYDNNDRSYKIIPLNERYLSDRYYADSIYLSIRETQDFEFIDFDIGV